MVLGDLNSYMQKNETQPPTYITHKNKLKMDKRLKYKSWYHKSPRGGHRRKISDIARSNIFTDTSPRERDVKEKINKWDFIKIKSFFMAKEKISKMKREPTVLENIFANISEKGLFSKIYRECTRLHSRKTNNPIKKWAKYLDRHFSKEDIQRAQRHMKGCLAH